MYLHYSRVSDVLQLYFKTLDHSKVIIYQESALDFLCKLSFCTPSIKDKQKTFGDRMGLAIRASIISFVEILSFFTQLFPATKAFQAFQVSVSKYCSAMKIVNYTTGFR